VFGTAIALARARGPIVLAAPSDINACVEGKLMIPFRLPRTVTAASVLAATLFGCSPPQEGEELEGSDSVATTTSGLVTQQVNDQPGGFRATVSLISNFNGINGWPNGAGTNTVRLAACDNFRRLDTNRTAGAQLYVATKTTSGTRHLYVANDGARDYGSGDPNVATGTTWSEIPSGLDVPATDQIGCDGMHLLALNPTTHNLYVAEISGSSLLRRGNGTFDFWSQLGTNSLFNDLQSGAGNLYVVGPPNKTLYTQDSTSFGTWKTFSNLPTNFVRVSGAGKATLATLAATAGNKFSGRNPPNRAFAIKTDGTLAYNDKVLSTPTANTWTNLDFGAATFEDISASAPDVLWAITNSGGMRHLHEIRFTELNCTDGVDNDGDSLTDGQDPDCRASLASTFCGSASNKVYCSSRFTNSSDYLVTCTNHALVGSPVLGRCVQNTFGPDTMIGTNIAEPSGTGHWCSGIYRPGGTWSVKTEVSPGVTNRDPCASIVATKPAGQTVEITGAGLYSVSGVNNVVAFCENGGGVGWVNQNRINGTAPIDDAVAAVAGAPGCKILVSPMDLPVLDLPYDKTANTQLGTSATWGNNFDPAGHAAWDVGMPEGVPVLAVARGTVVGTGTANGIAVAGSQDEDLSAQGTIGSSHQAEIAILHNVQSGTSGRYRESFVSVYVHMRQRIVEPGQVVEKGQIIGYVGQTGQAGGPHIHFGIVRLSNTAMSATDADTASTVVIYDPWPIRTEVTSNSAVSPFGFRGTGQDPWGVGFVIQGKGAFSWKLWNGASQTPSPAPAVSALGW
jgi:hypothetical protein